MTKPRAEDEARTIGAIAQQFLVEAVLEERRRIVSTLKHLCLSKLSTPSSAAIISNRTRRMSGPVSESSKGTPDDAPYVPSWCYPRGAKMCLCGHHEGYHGDDGRCLHTRHFSQCGCTGLPLECRSTDDEMWPLEQDKAK